MTPVKQVRVARLQQDPALIRFAFLQADLVHSARTYQSIPHQQVFSPKSTSTKILIKMCFTVIASAVALVVALASQANATCWSNNRQASLDCAKAHCGSYNPDTGDCYNRNAVAFGKCYNRNGNNQGYECV